MCFEVISLPLVCSVLPYTYAYFKYPELSQIPAALWTTSFCSFWTCLCVASFDGPVLAQDERTEVNEIPPYMTSLSLFNRLAAGLQIRCSLSAKYFSVSPERSILLFSDSFLKLEEMSSLFPIQKHSFTQRWFPIKPSCLEMLLWGNKLPIAVLPALQGWIQHLVKAVISAVFRVGLALHPLLCFFSIHSAVGAVLVSINTKTTSALVPHLVFNAVRASKDPAFPQKFLSKHLIFQPCCSRLCVHV